VAGERRRFGQRRARVERERERERDERVPQVVEPDRLAPVALTMTESYVARSTFEACLGEQMGPSGFEPGTNG
jgi:hypothetical protein